MAHVRIYVLPVRSVPSTWRGMSYTANKPKSHCITIQGFRIGIPGMALQMAGGYYFIKYILKNKICKKMKTLLFIGGIGMQEVLLITLVILLFFGGKKIPELMKGLGKGIKSFKEGMSEVTKDMEDEKKDGNKSELLGSSRPAADDNH